MQACRIRSLILLVGCFVLTLPKAIDFARAAEPIKFALPGNSMGYLPLFVAVHRGFFRDEGLEIELPPCGPRLRKTRSWRERCSITGSPIQACAWRRAVYH